MAAELSRQTVSSTIQTGRPQPSASFSDVSTETGSTVAQDARASFRPTPGANHAPPPITSVTSEAAKFAASLQGEDRRNFELLSARLNVAEREKLAAACQKLLNPETAVQSGLENRRKELVSDILRLAAHPDAGTKQGGRATCTVTSMESMLCKENPAEYARIVSGLATAGSVVLKDGSRLDLPKVNGGVLLDEQNNQFRSHRGLSEQLFQPAMMTFAVGPELKYDLVTDTVTGKWHPPLKDGTVGAIDVSTRGIYAACYEKALRSLTGNCYRRDDAAEIGGQAVLQNVKQTLQSGHASGVAAEIRWAENGGLHTNHMIVIERIDLQSGKVYFMNPQGNSREAPGTRLAPPPRLAEGGNIESMPIAEFQRRIQSALILDPSAKKVTPMPAAFGKEDSEVFTYREQDGSEVEVLQAPLEESRKSIEEHGTIEAPVRKEASLEQTRAADEATAAKAAHVLSLLARRRKEDEPG